MEEENGFLIEKRFDGRMVIMTPKREDSNYMTPEYTYIFAHGLMEKASNYQTMYLNPELPQKFPLPNSKYQVSPFQDKLPGDNYRLVFFNGPKRPITRFKGKEYTSWFDV